MSSWAAVDDAIHLWCGVGRLGDKDASIRTAVIQRAPELLLRLQTPLRKELTEKLVLAFLDLDEQVRKAEESGKEGK